MTKRRNFDYRISDAEAAALKSASMELLFAPCDTLTPEQRRAQIRASAELAFDAMFKLISTPAAHRFLTLHRTAPTANPN